MALQTKKRQRTDPEASQATRSQAQSSRRAAEEEEEEEDLDEEEDDGPPTATQKSGLSDKDLGAAATQLVRFALTNEYRRVPLRRDIIIKTVLPNHRQAYNAVFELAQKQLKAVFGMQLHELRKKAKAGEALSNGETQARKKGKGRARGAGGDEDEDEDEDEAEGADAGATKKRKAGSNTYFLRSTIPLKLSSLLSEPRPMNMFDADGNHLQGDDEDADPGSIIDWRTGDASGSGSVEMLGIRTVILCLVMVFGRVISDDNLHAFLSRLSLSRDTVLPYNSPQSPTPPLTLDRYLELLVKQGYLEKLKSSTTVGHRDENAAYEWRWGAREAEFSEQAAHRFLDQIFYPPPEDLDDEEDAARRRRRGQKSREEEREEARKKFKTSVEKAAGSALRGWD